MDRDGAVRIEGLWDGIIADAGKDRMGQGASTVRDAKVTSVSVTEHQYVPGTESVELFEGTAQQGDEIRFDEPVHSLSAEGFTILESGANYARLSAGNGTLTGLAYRHNTRIVTKPVHEAQTENGKDFGDKTLVSLVNSDAVAQRLANYYGSYDRIQAPMVYRDEIPGDRLSVYHPYDKEMVSACLESADITMSNKLKGDETLLVGFTPPSSGEITYETQRVVLTGRGIWQRPDGVTLVTYVLIGGAQGGKCGSPGSDGGEQEYFSYNTSAGNQERGYRYGRDTAVRSCRAAWMYQTSTLSHTSAGQAERVRHSMQTAWRQRAQREEIPPLGISHLRLGAYRKPVTPIPLPVNSMH